jgi:hypothetical protein
MALCNATARALLLTRRFPRSHLSSKCFLVPICATQSLSRFPGPAQAFRRHDARFWFWTSVSGHQDRDFQHLPLRTGQTVPETCSDASPLSRRQLDELYSGKFPTDHPSEVIKIPLSIDDYHRIHEAFDARNSRLGPRIQKYFSIHSSNPLVRAVFAFCSTPSFRPPPF